MNSPRVVVLVLVLLLCVWSIATQLVLVLSELLSISFTLFSIPQIEVFC